MVASSSSWFHCLVICITLISINHVVSTSDSMGSGDEGINSESELVGRGSEYLGGDGEAVGREAEVLGRRNKNVVRNEDVGLVMEHGNEPISVKDESVGDGDKIDSVESVRGNEGVAQRSQGVGYGEAVSQGLGYGEAVSQGVEKVEYTRNGSDSLFYDMNTLDSQTDNDSTPDVLDTLTSNRGRSSPPSSPPSNIPRRNFNITQVSPLSCDSAVVNDIFDPLGGLNFQQEAFSGSGIDGLGNEVDGLGAIGRACGRDCVLPGGAVTICPARRRLSKPLFGRNPDGLLRAIVQRQGVMEQCVEILECMTNRCALLHGECVNDYRLEQLLVFDPVREFTFSDFILVPSGCSCHAAIRPQLTAP